MTEDAVLRPRASASPGAALTFVLAGAVAIVSYLLWS